MKSVSFAIRNGFLHIFSSSVLNKIILFCSSIILVRFFTKDGYGQWSYANNILNIFLLFDGLGVASGLLQFCCENKNDEFREDYLKLSLQIGICFNLVLSLLIVAVSCIFNFPIQGSEKIFRWLFFIPFFTTIFSVTESYLRTLLRNKEYSVLSIINTSLILIFSVLGLYFFNVTGLIIGRYIAWIVTDFIGILFIRKNLGNFQNTNRLDKSQKKDFFSYSIICSLNNSIAGLMHLLDVFLVGLIIKDSSVVASYKTATLIPFALNFIPQSIMIFAYPYFVKLNSNLKEFRILFFKMEKYLAPFNCFISIVLVFFAPLIIKSFFGETYSDSILPFRILSVGYFFVATFRIPCVNILAALKKMRVNLVITIIDGILNIFLDIVLIQNLGSMGASIATSAIYAFSGFLVTVFVLIFMNRKVI